VASQEDNAFQLLLERLDPDPSLAGEKYELLRLKLKRCLPRRGCPDSDLDEVADKVLDRVASKLADGTQIENCEAYSCTVLRLVWLEHLRTIGKLDRTGKIPEESVEPSFPEDPDTRLACLRSCLVEVAPGDRDRRLILGYYDTEIINKIKEQRRVLAESLGLTMINLKVKAYRLRERLEKCINECVRKRMRVVTE
jgi:DNA-directed RNA polymerase specialized sigma24 family protein